MKTELFTVSKIFNESLFRIPDYQRGYSWEERHLKDFWADLEQLVDGKNHYTGVLTLEPVPAAIWEGWQDDTWIIKSRRYAPYYVVDGQQRLTTITILLHCILEAANDGDLNFTPTSDVRKKYIFDNKADSNARAYIFGYEKDNPSYEYLKTQIFGEQSDRHSTNEETIYTRNLRKAKEFFVERLAVLKRPELEELFTKVSQQLVFNVYEIAKEIDVFVAFETMNNRGKPLSALELLKNRLIYLATQFPDTDDGDGVRLRRIINDAWKTVYHNLGKNEKRPLTDDDFLRTHFSLYYQTSVTGDVPGDEDAAARFMSTYMRVLDNTAYFLLTHLFTRKRGLVGSAVQLPEINSAFLYEYTAHLKSAVEVYFRLSTPDQSNYSAPEKTLLERIGRLRGYGAGPLLLALYVLEKSGTKRLPLLEAFERCQFLMSMKLGLQRSTYLNRYINVEVVKFMKGKATIDDLITFYDNHVTAVLAEDRVAESIQNWIKNGPGYYGWRSINYFLYEYEIYLRDKSKSARNKIDWDEFCKEDFQSDYVSIEHIYPQKARAPYWVERFNGYTSVQKRLLRNSLGNLLALSRPKNSSLSNKPFPDKVGGDGDTVGYRYGSYSENEVAASPNWGPTEILERGIRMLTFMEMKWKFSIGDREQKIRALGLAFMLQKKGT